MASRVIRIGTRGSKLALWQADTVMGLLRAKYPGREFQQVIISTKGDRETGPPLASFGGVGVFTKEIESALSDGRIDLAVHSLKDLPTAQPRDLTLAAIMEREDPRDAFVAREVASFEELPEGARVATSSVRRKAQLLSRRPDLEIVSIRGNVPTRLRKLTEENLDAMILASAGLVRLGLDEAITQRLPFDVMVPAPGQGAVAVESRLWDEESTEMAHAAIHHEDTYRRITAERAVMHGFGGGCHVPLGALAEIDGNEMSLRAVVAAPDGSQVISRTLVCAPEEGEAAGAKLARELVDAGGKELLAEGAEDK